jgi:hypothetical protein
MAMALYMNGGGEWVRQLPDGTTVNLRTGHVEVLGDAWRQDIDLLMGAISKGQAIERATERAQAFVARELR